MKPEHSGILYTGSGQLPHPERGLPVGILRVRRE